MNSSRLAFSLIVVGVAVALLVARFLTESDKTVVVSQSQEEIAHKSVVQRHTSASSGSAELPLQSASGPTAPASSPSARLQAELLKASDWRAFALSAEARPAEGGYFYSMYVANLCGRDMTGIAEAARLNVRKAVESTGTVSTTQLQVAEKAISLCASFSHDEATGMFNKVKATAADTKLDPVFNSTQALAAALRTKDASTIRVALADLLELGDPVAVSYEGSLARVLASDPEARQVGGYWFGGKLYAPGNGEDFTLFTLALQLAQCSDSLPCQLDDSMTLACLGGRYCTQDRAAFLRNEYASDVTTERNFEEVLKLSGRIRQAVMLKQVGLLVRP
jgi:hypothetical protein